MRVLAVGLVGLTLVCAMLVSSPVSHAQTASDPLGLTAGSFLLRGRLVGIFPNNSDSTISLIGGHIEVSNSITPEVDLSYFLTDHLAIEGEAGITRNNLTAEDTALGRLDVGKVWGAPIIALLQYHLLPRSRWNPYAGVGVAFLPYFDAQPAGGLVQQLSVQSEVGAAFQAGIDLQVTGRWYGNLDLKKLIVSSAATVDDGAIEANGHIDPLIVGLGIGYRF
ncbi:OmpW/AlkL family protein [Acidisoma sp.]|uniref:OmpW/AlkL family protein n=1 Tax=Acidisoma sp. TaxID=1872115 RepID=UPI003AFFE7B3